MSNAADTVERLERVRALVADVRDPEIPVLTIADLGILRDVRGEGGRITVVITPTYMGCPAMQVIEDAVVAVLARAGYSDANVTTQLAPAWTTDWLSDGGRRKLEAIGIAPPAQAASSKRELLGVALVACPRCGSADTEVVSEFGSTPCKALHRCLRCREPFDYFKCL